VSSELPPTLESFYNFCGQGKLMGARCKSCGEILVPPRSLCLKCNSTSTEWMELKGTGKLLAYSIVHVAPSAFQSSAPYAVGIVSLAEGPRIPGMIRVEQKDLKVGLELKVAFESSHMENWPTWTRYYFVKADST